MSALDGVILDEIKKLLGMDPSYDVFDMDATIQINSVFADLQQLGVGPVRTFQIIDGSETWSNFFETTEIPENFASAKSYIFFKVKLMFDPPSVGYAVTAMKEQIKEMEWRLNVQAEGAFDS